MTNPKMSREEFFACFKEAHNALHRCWSKAVGTSGYDKADWKILDKALSRLGGDAAIAIGVDPGDPLLCLDETLNAGNGPDAASAFDKFVVELDVLLKGKHHNTKSVRLLNVGTSNAREHHWRFRTTDGEIVTITIEKEL